MPFRICLLVLSFVSTAAYADTYVNGYYRKNGTYVQPHYRSDSNGTKLDNWSSRGNVNPYTGKVGTKDPYSNSGTSYGQGSSFGSGNSNSFGNSNAFESSNSWDD